VLSRLLRAPFALEVRDPWTQRMIDLGVVPADHPLANGMRRVERSLYGRADLLVSATNAFVRQWAAQGVDTSSTIVVRNGVDLRQFTPWPRDAELRAELELRDRFVVAHVGSLEVGHGLEHLLAAARALASHAEIHFLFVGDGAAKSSLMRAAASHGLRNVTFLPAAAPHRVARFIAAADLLAVTVRDHPRLDGWIPPRMFEAMASARPLLLAVRGEAAAIVEDAGAGWVVEPGDVAAMVEAIREAHADPVGTGTRGELARMCATEQFDRERLAGAYADAQERLVSRRR
jgi:glycosyltransferase involved in cell wall biosynthesis